MNVPLEFQLNLQSACIVIHQQPWTIHSFNTTATRWFGSTLTEGMLVSSLISNINEKALRRRLKKGKKACFDYTVVVDEIELSVEFNCSPTHWIDEGFILEGHDLSRAQSAELMLASYSQMIETKTKELEAAIHARDAFFATISHELRTPLNSMIGFSESLLDEVYGEIKHEQEKIVEKIYFNGKNLLSLLNNLLHLSRIRSGELSLRFRTVYLDRLCRQVLDAFEDEAKMKHISLFLDIQINATLSADEQWCEQILENLIANAIKFTHADKKVGIIVKTGPLGVRVTVWDEGIGIPLEHQASIFQPFTQVESSLARTYDGSGLGLYVVAEVARLHGGIINVESIEGKGSRFHLDLPGQLPSLTPSEKTN